MDHVGHISDAKIRNNQAHKYLDIKESVKRAQKAIYVTGGAHQWGLCSAITEAYFDRSDAGEFRALSMLTQVL